MNCKACNKEIDYVKERQPRAYNFGTTEKHVCEGFGQKKSFSSGKARPIEADLELLAKISNLQGDVEQLKITAQRHDAEIKTLQEERE